MFFYFSAKADTNTTKQVRLTDTVTDPSGWLRNACINIRRSIGHSSILVSSFLLLPFRSQMPI